MTWHKDSFKIDVDCSTGFEEIAERLINKTEVNYRSDLPGMFGEEFYLSRSGRDYILRMDYSSGVNNYCIEINIASQNEEILQEELARARAIVDDMNGVQRQLPLRNLEAVL